MDMIVAEVGGSKATLYRSFPAKEALIAGLMDQVADGINRSVIDPTTDTRSLQQVLTDTGTDALRGCFPPRRRRSCVSASASTTASPIWHGWSGSTDRQ